MGEAREELEATIAKCDTDVDVARAEAEQRRDYLVSAIAARLQLWLPQYVQSRVLREPVVTKALGDRLSELKADVKTIGESLVAKNADWFNSPRTWPHREDYVDAGSRHDFRAVSFSSTGSTTGSTFVRKVLTETFAKVLANTLGKYGYHSHADIFPPSEVTNEFNAYVAALDGYDKARSALKTARDALAVHEASVLWDKA